MPTTTPKQLPILIGKFQVRNFLTSKCKQSFRVANEIIINNIMLIENKTLEDAKKAGCIMPKTWFAILDEMIGFENLERLNYVIKFDL